MIEQVSIDDVPRALYRQFTGQDLEDEIRERFKALYNREPEHVYEVCLPTNHFYLAGPINDEEKGEKLDG